jgi:hypothetical protein
MLLKKYSDFSTTSLSNISLTVFQNCSVLCPVPYFRDRPFNLQGGLWSKIVGVFRVKNHDFTPKNLIFSDCGGGTKIFEVFRVKNHDFTTKNHILLKTLWIA